MLANDGHNLADNDHNRTDNGHNLADNGHNLADNGQARSSLADGYNLGLKLLLRSFVAYKVSCYLQCLLLLQFITFPASTVLRTKLPSHHRYTKERIADFVHGQSPRLALRFCLYR